MPQGLMLQERDEIIFHWLKEHGPHSIRAIAEFYFEGRIDATRKRIQKLTKKKFLLKSQIPGDVARYIVESKDTPPIHPPTLEHDFQVKETLAALLCLIRDLNLGFTVAHSLMPRLTTWFLSTDPDAHIQLTSLDGREEHLFIEQDRGTEPLRTIVRKCRRYQHLKQAEPSKVFRTLFVCKSAQRAENICKILQKETSIKKLVWCAAYDDVMARPSKPIWITPSQTVEELELFPTSKQNS